ncbi:MAG: ferrous iron transport protein B [Kiritimatiellia bacterium]
MITIALAGNPNTGKSTFFNNWSGSRQQVGNWPGVTVERHEGRVRLESDQEATIVDLPGMYSLRAAGGQDEKVAADFILGGKYDLIVNVVDAMTLERNLFLTLEMLALHRPAVVALSMCDVFRKTYGCDPDTDLLSRRLGVPVVATELDRTGRKNLLKAISRALEDQARTPRPRPLYPATIKHAVAHIQRETGCDEDTAIRRLEAVIPGSEEQIRRFANQEEVPADVFIAEARYAKIDELLKGLHHAPKGDTLSRRIDRIVMNRWLGIPIFLAAMYALFWFTQVVGGCFIDFFDIAGGALFVNGLSSLLQALHAPDWLVQILANGLGTGVQTLLTFIPPVFFIFLGLSVLEDSGYMARAAVVMDRFMRLLGLPGSAFVPLLVGFGCTVPAVMATRALPSRRDRLLSIFMAPFMSCGARLPVYALFGAAFFGAKAGLAVFALYLAGVLLAVCTGLLLKNTLFKGTHSPFVMELPMYHIPSFWATCKSAWERLRFFLFRAGKVLVCMVALLSLLRNVEFGGKSLLHRGGEVLTPVFRPMGVEQENWQASVALCVGLFAKEAVIGSLNTLYAAEAAGEGSKESVSPEESAEADGGVVEQLKEAFASIPANLGELAGTVLDPLGLGVVGGDEESVAEQTGADASVLGSLRRKFVTGHQAFAYLLFILLYVPCLAAMATILREAGSGYGLLLAGYLTILGWCVATLYYQIAVGREAFWIILPILILSVIAAVFGVLGRSTKTSIASTTDQTKEQHP